MSPSPYQPSGSLISPGDILDKLPPVKLPTAIKVARKWAYNLPAKFQVKGELHDVLEVGKNLTLQDSKLGGMGEQVLVATKTSRVIFLTWGSEVEDDERSGKLDKKHWLVAPITPITDELRRQRTENGETIADAIVGNKSPHFFYLPCLPGDEPSEYYVDFRKICPVAASHVQRIDRKWRLSSLTLNDFYHQLMWFFTRQKIFFEPLSCSTCGARVESNVIFEGQPVEPEPLE
jgi:hypothetical protein